jgi:pimeloyl-ACP methyl ester carboxylesterase
MSRGATTTSVTYRSIDIDGLPIVYREAGTPGKPKVVLLHGFPSSSHQYRDLIGALSDRFHVIASDYRDFGNSGAPDPGADAYSFNGEMSVGEGFRSIRFVRPGLWRPRWVPHRGASSGSPYPAGHESMS